MTLANPIVASDRPEDITEWLDTLFIQVRERDYDLDEDLVFWGRIAERLLEDAAYLPVGEPISSLINLEPTRAKAWLREAPIGLGGLTVAAIQEFWEKAITYLADQSVYYQNIRDWAVVDSFAPHLKTLGRVIFNLAENHLAENHLAENPAPENKLLENHLDSDRPFVFMATVVTEIGLEDEERQSPLYLALNRFASEGARYKILKVLSPIFRAAKKIPLIAEAIKTAAIYKPIPLTVAQARKFLEGVPQMEAAGIEARIPNWWRKKNRLDMRLILGENKLSSFSLDAILDWNVSLSLGDQSLSKDDVEGLLAGEAISFFKGQWLAVDKPKLKEALSRWDEVEKVCGDGLSFVEGMRLLAGYDDSLALDEFFPEEEGTPNFGFKADAGAALAQILKELRAPGAAEIPSSLQATLRAYQEKGLSWLAFLSGLGLGACLADDMGLGKTIQVLALLLLDQKRGQKTPSLLVAPASLLANWQDEAKRFAPDLRLTFFHPAENPKEKIAFWKRHPERLQDNCDLVVTSYGFLARQEAILTGLNWRLAIIDEAQAIKNPATQQSKAIRKLKAQARVALTGTPIENSLDDIWSIFDFLNPGLLGTLHNFNAKMAKLSSRDGNKYEPLKRLVAPYILRRLKSDKTVIADLPDKTEITAHCWLTVDQAKLYREILRQLQESLSQLRGENAKNCRRGVVFQAIMRLKQLCNHPAQLTGDMDWSPERSGKFVRLAELTREIAQSQDKVLIFTQFKEIIEPLRAWLTKIFGRDGLVLHGSTPVKDRFGLVERFQKPEGPPFFILSLKAGGMGLNLTAATHVIHFDRWWNPAVEDQATDRAYRVGQKRNVLVHKCVTRGTMEERIDKTLREKRVIAGEILTADSETSIVDLDDEALLNLLRLDLDRAVH
ncbi:MAG: DEAD/DEAH box helicase [Deltaproteobacteria bacterium]|nr:DEAD/DEAH box helicase [Deltaproteobacteria bacterium]